MNHLWYFLSGLAGVIAGALTWIFSAWLISIGLVLLGIVVLISVLVTSLYFLVK